MKKSSAMCFAVTVMVMMAAVGVNEAKANVFASDVKVVNPGGGPFDGNLADATPGVGIMFRLNENATSVTITISNFIGVVATINAGPHHQGVNLVVWSGVDDAGMPVPAGDYTFEVTASDAVGHSAYDVIYAMSGTSIFTRGGTTIRNPAAPNFGHPIGGNGGGSGLKRGPLNFFADGTGFAFTEPGLSRYSPWDVRNVSGDPAAGRLYMLTSDDDGWLYYSDEVNPAGKLYRFAPSLDPTTLKAIAVSHIPPARGMGIDVVGTGANKVIYWGVGNTIVRLPIGEADTVEAANFQTIATFENDMTGGTNNPVFIRDIVIDDSGFMYVSLRRGTPTVGINPGLAVEKYDISGTLPVTRVDRLWTIPVGFDNSDGRPVGFGIDRGEDRTTNADDRIYFSGGSGTADGNWNTIRKIDDLNTGGSTVVFVDISGTGTTSDNADMAVDAAGNLIWFENSSEWLIAISPPDGPNSFTTPASEMISITTASAANAHPDIVSVTDAPNDQGNQVRVAWTGSVLDRLGNAGISIYEVYRRVNSNASVSKVSGPPGAWEFVGSSPARQTSNYFLIVPTLYNQTPDTTIYSAFYISAVAGDGKRWDSPPDSGFSIDNLVPSAPTNVVAKEGGTPQGQPAVLLNWDESPDADFKYFAVVRGTAAGFDPTTADVIGTVTENQFTDADVSIGASFFYRIVAFDFNGNRGVFSDEVSLTVTAVNERPTASLPTEFALLQNYPNPFNPSTQIAYDLASQRHISLKIFNTMGQVVKTLVDGEQPAGRYTITWDGTSEAGTRVASGVYLYVIKAGDFVQSRRMTVLK
ncbi:T9SS type A sorting domain-containing protein [candidate division KSB1 bacterium]|nr:T9SS type A sorting domain-containing protein [candidate division KSB1 bacterium]